MLNEFTYCPRLAYLEWVEGEFRENLETLEGTFAHRNVDRPSRGEVPDGNAECGVPNAEWGDEEGDADDHSALRVPQSAIHSRSLMLSAPGEGLIAKLDLLELDGSVATPVDYKRGRVPDVAEGAWEPERVQLCAQGLILRENGYRCDAGVIYFVASNRRVQVRFDEGLVARTRQLVVELRAIGAAGRLPPPLVDSPKCPRCSLVSICLPDETNLLQTRTPQPDGEPSQLDDAAPGNDSSTPLSAFRTPHSRPRRLLPARDDALPLYVQTQGAVLGKSGGRLTVKERGKTLTTVKLKDVSQVCLFGNVQATATAVGELTARGVPVCHFSSGGWFRAVTHGMTHKNVELRIAQFARAADPAGSLELARRFVVGKIRNCRTLLRRHSQGDRRFELMQLAEHVHKAEAAAAVESLLGIEGMAAKIYFSGFSGLLNKQGETFDIAGRNRRPPKDPVNAMLSFVYALLVKELAVAAQAVGFDPMLGFYHRPRYGRPSLALDLAEEFRPIIGDSVVLTLVNNGEVSESSFVRRAGSVAMTAAGRRAVLAAFERRLENEITHPLFGYRVSYRRILEVQTRLLARTLLGELAEYPNFCTR
ncbi:MAG: CRISPR-associated endonuclease Cas1 [Planctomycetes bacterium]|nr:CRISPR-associated endonuclease Cas1 [Planctomycetota bacterium]